jgi:hypothetical protein
VDVELKAPRLVGPQIFNFQNVWFLGLNLKILNLGEVWTKCTWVWEVAAVLTGIQILVFWRQNGDGLL